VHLTTSPADWYAARAAGIVAYLLLSTSVSLGLTLSWKKQLRRWPRFALEDVHRFCGLLVGLFIAIHVVTIAIDSFLPFSLTQILVPFTSAYRPITVALGIVTAELLVALAITNHYRKRLPYRFWRTAHYLNFGVWLAATAHGIGSGTDRSAPWLVVIYAVAIATVVSLTALRFLRPRPAALALGLGCAALVSGLVLGPVSAHTRPWNAKRFADRLTGRILVQSGVTRGIVSMAGEGRGDQRVLVRADLLLAPNRIDETSFQLEFLPSGAICRGGVTTVQQFAFTGSCRMPDGTSRVVSAQWTGDGAGGLVGTLDAHA
jgi:methionine sulfoxide reductase heme-binding subunit